MKIFTTATLLWISSLQIAAQVDSLTWTSLPTVSGPKLTSVWFTSATTGFATESSWGVIYKTTDGGNSWVEFSGINPNLVPPMYSICFINDNTGIAVGGVNGSSGTPGGTVYRTTDGGVTWSFQVIDKISWLESVHFPDENTGFAVGWVGSMIKTTDGGLSWTRLNSSTHAMLQAVFFINPDTGFVVGSDATIRKTTDGGATWSPLQAGVSGIYLLSVWFTGKLTGYVTGEKGTLLRTTDGGMTWSKLAVGPVGASLGSIFFTDQQTGYVAGDSGIILATRDSGATWEVSRPGGHNRLNSLFFMNGHLGYAVGENGMVLQATSPYGEGLQEDIRDQEDIEIFPNPASGRVTLRHNLGGATDMKVVILSMMGVPVSPGRYHHEQQFNLDISGLPVGLYILRATTERLVICKKLWVRPH